MDPFLDPEPLFDGCLPMVQVRRKVCCGFLQATVRDQNALHDHYVYAQSNGSAALVSSGRREENSPQLIPAIRPVKFGTVRDPWNCGQAVLLPIQCFKCAG